jgi:chitodextrinase
MVPGLDDGSLALSERLCNIPRFGDRGRRPAFPIHELQTMWSPPSTWGRRRAGLAVTAAALSAVTVLSPTAAGGPKQLRPPSGVALVGVTATSLSLSWSTSRYNERWGHVAGYGLYKNGTRVGTTKETRYTFDGLACGTTFALGVETYTEDGKRSQTVTLTASTAACAGDTSPPSSPSGVSPTAATTTGISLAWNASADNVGVTGYGVYRNGANVGTTTGTSFTFADLACGTTYTLGVDAFDAAGNRSTIATVTASTAACAPAPTPPSMPTGLVQSGATTTSIALRWNPATDDVGVAGYRVYLKGAPVGTTSQTTYTLGSLACGTGYAVAVEAYDADGNRSAQASIVAATSACPATRANPVPPPASGAYWGARIDGDVYARADAPWDGTTWNLFEQHAGKRVSLLHFGHGASPTVRDFDTNRIAFDLVVARRAIPYYDVFTGSDSLADISAGRYDTQLRTFAAQAAAWNRPFLLRFNAEMNGTWSSWGAQTRNNPSVFVAVWRRFHDIAEQAGARNIAWVWCPNTEFTGSTPLEQLYPGDAYVDWTCIDGYNFGTNPLKDDAWMTFEQRFRQTYNHLLQLAPTKPIMIGETASTEYGGAKDGWIRDALAAMPQSFPKIRAFSWFNWNIYQNGGRWDWPIESSAAAQRAFAEGIASSYYVPAP